MTPLHRPSYLIRLKGFYRSGLRSWFFLTVIAILIGCSSPYPEEVAEAYEDLPEVIDFNFHVRPILSDRCFHCHGPDENARKAGLRLDTREAAISQLHENPGFPIVPNKPGSSEVIHRVLSTDEALVMPPAESKLLLSAEEKAILIKWIEQGAEWKKHWAFIPPEKALLPEVKDTSWPINELDYFVLDKLERMELKPSERADKRTLIRRLSFDLTGLPPTLEEIQGFLSDDSPQAYEKVVDRLMASESYGERWAWEWLDVARYADTNGYQGDPTRIMWPWRDWVIEAFNSNMLFDEFTVKQIGGDLLPDPTRKDILATAFNRNHPFNGEGGKIVEETRVNNVFDRVETVGTAWLGLTLNCSRCHDHKFDDISQKEYYQLYSYFNQTSESGKGSSGMIPPLLDMSPEEDRKKLEDLKAYLQEVAARIDQVELTKFPRKEGEPASQSAEIQAAAGNFFNAFDDQAFDRRNFQLKQIYNFFKTKDPEYAGMIDDLNKTLAAHDKQAESNLMVMVMDQLETPRPNYILTKGNYASLEEEVFPDVPSVLPPLPEDMPNNRLALAQWLVSRENPLSARVTINRYWQSFFGAGLVKTSEDFGVQGALPTHPELLDWLAVDFQESGWDLKALFKKIVMSATYQQSSRVTEELLEADPENKLLARATRIRLPSWMLRDQALFASGLLVDSLGGEPVKPYQPSGIWEEATFGKRKYEQGHGDDLYRRTLYTFWRRIVGPTMLFDNSSRQVCEVKTTRTNTPLHALTTLNDITYAEAARVFASNILAEKKSDDERMNTMFEVMTSRKPGSRELKILYQRLEDLRDQFAAQPLEAKKLINAGEYQNEHSLDQVDHAAYTVLCSVVMNLDETITRQ